MFVLLPSPTFRLVLPSLGWLISGFLVLNYHLLHLDGFLPPLLIWRILLSIIISYIYTVILIFTTTFDLVDFYFKLRSLTFIWIITTTFGLVNFTLNYHLLQLDGFLPPLGWFGGFYFRLPSLTFRWIFTSTGLVCWIFTTTGLVRWILTSTGLMDINPVMDINHVLNN